MDLVSDTLMKYLKHRFNGQQGQRSQSPSSNSEQVIQNNNLNTLDDDDDEEDGCNSIGIHEVQFYKVRPCCVAINDDLTHIAAGFENSQIYLWPVIHKHDEDNATITTNQQLPEPVVTLAPPPTGNHDYAEIQETTSSATPQKQPQHKPLPNKIELGGVSRLTAHSGSVYCIQFLSGTNDLMLSCSEDTTIRLWCLESKCNLFVYRGHNYPVWSIRVATQGNYFASASMDTTARLWRFDRMCPVRVFCGHDDDVECVEFHPNAKYIATGSSDSTVRLWNISDGRMVRLMLGHKDSITSLSFLPNGKFLASASSDGAIKIWNLATNSLTNDLFVSAPYNVSFSPRQEFIATCGSDQILRLWQVEKSGIIEKKQVVVFNNTTSNNHNHNHHRPHGQKEIMKLSFVKKNRLFLVCFEKRDDGSKYANDNHS